MSEHTPGPWEVAGADHNGQAIVRSEHIEICTCWHHCVGSIEREMHANALLIASAPAMLKALKGVVRVADRATDEFDAARAAIAAAEGKA